MVSQSYHTNTTSTLYQYHTNTTPILHLYYTETRLILSLGTHDAMWSLKTTKDVSSVRWFNDQEELLEGEDFKLQTSEEKDHLVHSVIFHEVYPDDQGTYRVIIQNQAGETKESSAVLTGIRFYDYFRGSRTKRSIDSWLFS